MATRTPLFEEVCSTDFLAFSFGGRSYRDQLNDSIAKTKVDMRHFLQPIA